MGEKNVIMVRYEKGGTWKMLNANPETLKQAISTLYAVAPFDVAKVMLGWLPTVWYTWENSKVRRVKLW